MRCCRSDWSGLLFVLLLSTLVLPANMVDFGLFFCFIKSPILPPPPLSIFCFSRFLVYYFLFHKSPSLSCSRSTTLLWLMSLRLWPLVASISPFHWTGGGVYLFPSGWSEIWEFLVLVFFFVRILCKVRRHTVIISLSLGRVNYTLDHMSLRYV